MKKVKVVALSMVMVLILSLSVSAIGVDWIQKAKDSFKFIGVHQDYVTIMINGEVMDLPSFLTTKDGSEYEERIYIPLREFVEKYENLGFEIQWDDSTKTANVVMIPKILLEQNETIKEVEVIKYVCITCKDEHCDGSCDVAEDKVLDTDTNIVIINDKCKGDKVNVHIKDNDKSKKNEKSKKGIKSRKSKK